MDSQIYQRSLGRVLVYGGARNSRRTTAIEGFVDSDYADCVDSRKSLTGFVFIALGMHVIVERELALLSMI